MNYDRNYEKVVLRLPFDEADGATATADYSLVPKTVTMVNCEIDNTQTLFGNAVKFGATSGRVEIADHPDFAFGTQDWSIDISVYPTSNATRQTIFAKRPNASTDEWVRLYYEPGAGLILKMTGGGSSITSVPFSWTLNTWNRIRILKTPTVYTRIRNGNEYGGATPRVEISSDTSPITIGANADGSEPLLNAWVDEVRIRYGLISPVQSTYLLEGEAFDIAPFAGKTAEVLSFRKYVGGETPLPKVTLVPHLRALRDFLLVDGTGRIAGTVKEKNSPANTPLARRVVLLRDIDAQVIAETISDPVTGAYEFTRLREGLKYTVLAFDHQHNYRAAVADNLEPTL